MLKRATAKAAALHVQTKTAKIAAMPKRHDATLTLMAMFTVIVFLI
jgi:hypothetical protein